MLHFLISGGYGRVKKKKSLQKIPSVGLNMKGRALEEISSGSLEQKVPTGVWFDVPHGKTF